MIYNNYDNYDMPQVIDTYRHLIHNNLEAQKDFMTEPSPFGEYPDSNVIYELNTHLLGPAPHDIKLQDFEDFAGENHHSAVANYGGGILLDIVERKKGAGIISGVLDAIGLGKEEKKELEGAGAISSILSAIGLGKEDLEGGNFLDDLNTAFGGSKMSDEKKRKLIKKIIKKMESVKKGKGKSKGKGYGKDKVEDKVEDKKGAGIISGVLDAIGLGKDAEDPSIEKIRKEIIKNAKKHGGHQYTNGSAIIPGEEVNVAESIETRVNRLTQQGGASGFSILKKAADDYKKGGNMHMEKIDGKDYNVPMLREQLPSKLGPIFGSAKLSQEEKEKRKVEKEAKKAEKEAKKAEKQRIKDEKEALKRAKIEAKEQKKRDKEHKKEMMEMKKKEKEEKKKEREAKQKEREAKKKEAEAKKAKKKPKAPPVSAIFSAGSK